MPCPKCAEGWVCEEHPDKPWPHDDCAGPGVPCKEPGCELSLMRVPPKDGPRMSRSDWAAVGLWLVACASLAAWGVYLPMSRTN